MTQTTPSLPPVSDQEAKLPSKPVVARTGPEANLKMRQLRIVGTHEITNVWEDLAPKVIAILDAKGVNFITMDVLRFGYEDEPSGNPVIWIGVTPNSVSYEVGIDAALQCKELLSENGLDDVEIEIHETVRWPKYY
ncbi:hypothetical protein EDB85DRAFT_1872602 [Lactarius pseudohatsudake]|nr:hypothetical protein EDB85DRAFT_1875145 [Lactarius pseudohatsudake]KAH9020307.1 hypothetical protein EDB85DRAFT_1872602 [Lactarius pseudohatsudake]